MRAPGNATQALNGYARSAGRAEGQALAALNRHYGAPPPPHGRAAKDVHAIQLVRAAPALASLLLLPRCSSLLPARPGSRLAAT